MDAVAPGGIGRHLRRQPGRLRGRSRGDRADRARGPGRPGPGRSRSSALPRLRELAATSAHVGDARGRGAMLALEFVQPGSTAPDADAARAVAAYANSQGVLTLTCGTFGNVIRLLPPLVITDEQLDDALAVLAEGVADARMSADTSYDAAHRRRRRAPRGQHAARGGRCRAGRLRCRGGAVGRAATVRAGWLRAARGRAGGPGDGGRARRRGRRPGDGPGRAAADRRAGPLGRPAALLRRRRRGGFVARRRPSTTPPTRRRTCAGCACRSARSPCSGPATSRSRSAPSATTRARRWPPGARWSPRRTRRTRGPAGCWARWRPRALAGRGAPTAPSALVAGLAAGQRLVTADASRRRGVHRVPARWAGPVAAGQRAGRG